MGLHHCWRLVRVGLLALVMVAAACGSKAETSSTTSSASQPPTSIEVTASWETLVSGDEEGVGWELQVREGDDGDLCSRILTSPSPVPEEKLEGTCVPGSVLADHALVSSGAAVLPGTRVALTGGVVADDVTSIRYVTTDGDEIPVEIVSGTWVISAPTAVQFSTVLVERQSGAEECSILPESDLVMGQLVCGTGSFPG